MNEANKCPRCGAVVPANASEGLCPRCLGAMNLEPDTAVTGAEAAAGSASPRVSELEPLFPQLDQLGLIGRGGMGAVYKARQKELDRVVALKVLPPAIGNDPAFAERFAREAKALARLNHPGIVAVYDFGRAGGLFYFLMEFVDGVSLRQLINAGRVSPREALAIVPQICDALQYAHDQGIVHRDIKPENILLDRQGRVKVADFGLAKLIGEGRKADGLPGAAPAPAEGGVPEAKRPVGVTEAGQVIGTPQYMAPEQAEHPGEVDHRADIYALGVVFYQMLTGKLPTQRIAPPSTWMGGLQIDVRLDEVVLRALEKEPERRYQQVSEVKTAVETILRTPASPVAVDQRPADSWSHGPLHAPVRRSVVILAVLAGVVFLTLVVVLTLFFRVHMEPPGRLLTQFEFQQLLESNQITQATIIYRPEDPDLREVRGRYWKLEEGKKIEAPFRTRVRLRPDLELKLLSLPQVETRAFSWWRDRAKWPADLFRRDLTKSSTASPPSQPGLLAPAPVLAMSAHRGNIGVYLACVGSVESSNLALFNIPGQFVQEVVKKLDAGQSLTITAYDQSGMVFGHGSLLAVDNRINVETGELTCKARLLPDAGNIMVPGLFLNIWMLLDLKHNVIRVPAEAIMRDPESEFVWVIKPDQTVTLRRVRRGPVELPPPDKIVRRLMEVRSREDQEVSPPREFSGEWVEVQSGLALGELVVFDGQLKLSEGRRVTYKLVEAAAAEPKP